MPVSPIKALILLLLTMSSVYLNGQGKPSSAPDTRTGRTKHSIGEKWGGGIIVWLDATGTHGLVAAPTDCPGAGLPWNPGPAVKTAAVNDGPGSGLDNTRLIAVAQGSQAAYAARSCDELVVKEAGTSYDDWYLPSRQELALLFQNRSVIGGFNTTNGIYWSSTESTTSPETMAWEQEFKFGAQYEDDKDVTDRVRCIRKF